MLLRNKKGVLSQVYPLPTTFVLRPNTYYLLRLEVLAKAAAKAKAKTKGKATLALQSGEHVKARVKGLKAILDMAEGETCMCCSVCLCLVLSMCAFISCSLPQRGEVCGKP